MTPSTTPTLADIVLVPFLLYAIGALIFLVIVYKGRTQGFYSKFRWLGVVLTVIGFGLSLGAFWDAVNPRTGFLYRQMLNKELYFAHVGTPFIALIVIALMVGVDYSTRRHIQKHYFE
jgi:hypothetical protein